LRRRVTGALEKWSLSTEPGLSARFGLYSAAPFDRSVFSGRLFRAINPQRWRSAKHHKEAVRMRSFLGFSLLAAVALSSGCASAPRPQPLVRSYPTDKKRDPATDPSNATVSVEQATETSSSTSLSSRFTKLFSRQDSSDRMPLPRSDQPPGNGPGDDASRQALGRDF
jgi:hypothetical protein